MVSSLERRLIRYGNQARHRLRAFTVGGQLSIKHRLALAFITINLLFAINVAFFMWSNVRRKTTVEDHRHAMAAEKTIAEIQQKLINIQKQVALLSEAVVDSA